MTQIAIGGKNKFLINGRNALPKRVQDMFKSVQLNVDNPHFLIMQGRITKVSAPPVTDLRANRESCRMAGWRHVRSQHESPPAATTAHDLEGSIGREPRQRVTC